MSQKFVNPYPDYDVLEKWNSPSWNDITRDVIRARLDHVPPRRFLEPQDFMTLEAVCDRMIPQPERDTPVPIAPWIDEKLWSDRKDGYRYEGMPPLREAWTTGLAAIDDEARRRFGADFHTLSPDRQDEVLACIQQGETQSPLWHGMPPGKFFSAFLITECIAIYYAHPASWNEIGFGGPASPRGYARLRADIRDPWEAHLSDDWDEVDDAAS